MLNHKPVVIHTFFPTCWKPAEGLLEVRWKGAPVATKEGDVQVIRDGLTFKRYFTKEGVHPFDEIEWELRDAVIPNYKEGGNAFEQREVEFPVTWSQNATNIVSQKYFRGHLGTPQREWSVRHLVGRIVDSITNWGRKSIALVRTSPEA